MNTYHVQMVDGALCAVKANSPEKAIQIAREEALVRIAEWPLTPQSWKQATTIGKLELVET